jgi:hypothetical protein
MKNGVDEYLARCLECHQARVEHHHPTRLFQPIPILEWRMDIIIMDFITHISKIKKQNYSIMVIVDKLNKDAHFILVKSTDKAINIVEIFMKEISRMHGIPKTII